MLMTNEDDKKKKDSRNLFMVQLRRVFVRENNIYCECFCLQFVKLHNHKYNFDI